MPDLGYKPIDSVEFAAGTALGHLRMAVPRGEWFRPTSSAWSRACHRLWLEDMVERQSIKGTGAFEYRVPVTEQREAAQRPRSGSP